MLSQSHSITITDEEKHSHHDCLTEDCSFVHCTTNFDKAANAADICISADGRGGGSARDNSNTNMTTSATSENGTNDLPTESPHHAIVLSSATSPPSYPPPPPPPRRFPTLTEAEAIERATAMQKHASAKLRNKGIVCQRQFDFERAHALLLSSNALPCASLCDDENDDIRGENQDGNMNANCKATVDAAPSSTTGSRQGENTFIKMNATTTTTANTSDTEPCFMGPLCPYLHIKDGETRPLAERVCGFYLKTACFRDSCGFFHGDPLAHSKLRTAKIEEYYANMTMAGGKKEQKDPGVDGMVTGRGAILESTSLPAPPPPPTALRYRPQDVMPFATVPDALRVEAILSAMLAEDEAALAAGETILPSMRPLVLEPVPGMPLPLPASSPSSSANTSQTTLHQNGGEMSETTSDTATAQKKKGAATSKKTANAQVHQQHHQRQRNFQHQQEQQRFRTSPYQNVIGGGDNDNREGASILATSTSSSPSERVAPCSLVNLGSQIGLQMKKNNDNDNHNCCNSHHYDTAGSTTASVNMLSSAATMQSSSVATAAMATMHASNNSSGGFGGNVGLVKGGFTTYTSSTAPSATNAVKKNHNDGEPALDTTNKNNNTNTNWPSISLPMSSSNPNFLAVSASNNMNNNGNSNTSASASSANSTPPYTFARHNASCSPTTPFSFTPTPPTPPQQQYHSDQNQSQQQQHQQFITATPAINSAGKHRSLLPPPPPPYCPQQPPNPTVPAVEGRYGYHSNENGAPQQQGYHCLPPTLNSCQQPPPAVLVMNACQQQPMVATTPYQHHHQRQGFPYHFVQQPAAMVYQQPSQQHSHHIHQQQQFATPLAAAGCAAPYFASTTSGHNHPPPMMPLPPCCGVLPFSTAFSSSPQAMMMTPLLMPHSHQHQQQQQQQEHQHALVETRYHSSSSAPFCTTTEHGAAEEAIFEGYYAYVSAYLASTQQQHQPCCY